MQCHIFFEIIQCGGPVMPISAETSLTLIGKMGVLSNCLGMQALNRHKSFVVWPTAMRLAYTCASTHEEYIYHFDQ